nr:hypothetical protein GCM10020063_018650 [Dactylosporangium thailandense]
MRDDPPQADLPLTPESRAELLELIAAAFTDLGSSRRLLSVIGFPAAMLPGWPAATSALAWWDGIFTSLDSGLVPEGYRRLLLRARRERPGNVALHALQGRLEGSRPEPAQPRVRRILLLGASPTIGAGGDPIGGLDPQAEFHAVAAAVRPAIEVDYRPYAGVDDIRGMLGEATDVLHLACHGSGAMLTFHDDAAPGAAARRPARVIHAADLAAVLLAYEHAPRGHRLHGIMLNACRSLAAAAALRPCADVVVAHEAELPDEAAPIVAGAVYRALRGVGRLDAAAHVARAELPWLDTRHGELVARGMRVLPPATMSA